MDTRCIQRSIQKFPDEELLFCKLPLLREGKPHGNTGIGCGRRYLRGYMGFADSLLIEKPDIQLWTHHIIG